MTTAQPPDQRPAKGSSKKGPARRATIVGRRELSPHLVRLTLRCDDIVSGEIAAPPWTDAYVKVEFTDPAGDPVVRSYTVRNWRADAGEFDLDFVVHGDQGLAGPWARAARVGDEVGFKGPGGAWSPDLSEAVFHLFAGDLAALPAIEAALDVVPASHDGLVVIAHDHEADIRSLATHLTVEWVVVEGDLPAALDLAVTRIEAQPLSAESLEVFVHGEAGFVRRLRRHLRVDRGVPAERQSISGYWKLGAEDREWRAQKKDWNAPVDDAEAAVAGGLTR